MNEPEKGKIRKGIDEYFEKKIFTTIPKSDFLGNANNLKELLTGKAITADDLYKESEKDLLISMYIHLVQLNGKVKWHDWFIKGLISTVVIGIIAGVIIFCLQGIL